MNYNSFLKIVRWMRQHKKLVIFVITIILIAILASCGLVTSTVSMAVAGMVIPGTDGGNHVVDGPLTTELSKEGSPDLLLNEIDQQIVKIRPMSTPIDQISRYAGSKHAGSMVVDFYRVDTKPTSTELKEDIPEMQAGDVDETPIIVIETLNDDIFDATDTILVQGVSGYQTDGVTRSGHDLILYVVERDSNGLKVMAVNGRTLNGVTGCFPFIPSGTTLVRMGRAASELDVQSPQFEALPTKGRNLCQIFKMQVEQSTLQRLSNKEVGWTMSDQEEAAIYDMRLGMEKSFLFGSARQLWDNNKKEHIYFTGGIWNQADNDYWIESSVEFSENEMIDLMRKAFTGNAGSKRKILIGGSGLISRISKLEYTRVINAGQHVSKWGIDFNLLLIVHNSEICCIFAPDKQLIREI